MDFKRRLVMGVATGCGVGLAPWAPGTFGSVLGLALYLPLSCMPAEAIWPAIGVLAAIAVWAAHQAEAFAGARDPGQVVIDEVVGMMVTLAALPATLSVWMTGFLLFRFFDILKPFPIGYLEKKCPGGLGIVIDDVLAGAAAHLLLRALLAAGVPPFA